MRQIAILVCTFLVSALLVTIHGPPSQAYAEIDISEPYAVAIHGERIVSIGLDTPVILQVELKNSEEIEQPYLAIIEVRGSDDITVYLQFQKGRLGPNSETHVGISWTPEQMGIIMSEPLLLAVSTTR
jgi:hypothetical protein